MSLPEADQISIIGTWVKREAALDAELRTIRTSEIGRTCLLWVAADKAPDIPTGQFFSTVFYRYVGALTDAPHFQVGIQMRSIEVAEEPIEVVFGTMDTIEGGLICPEEGINPEDAEAVGTLAMRKQRWAALRGLELSDDATCLLLVPTQPLPTAA